MKYSAEEIESIISKGKSYWLVKFTPGQFRDNDDETDAQLQIGHLDHLFSLKDEKKLLLAGPTPNDESIRGICIFSGELTKDEVEKLLQNDPKVKAGILIPVVTDFFGIPGDVLD